MSRNAAIRRRLPLLIASLAVVALAVLMLYRVDQLMTVRYQAVGMVSDADGAPLAGVAVALLLSPPPDASARTRALHAGTPCAGAPAMPKAGVSGANGAYLVRACGRLGAAQAIRLGLDDTARPPYETGWLVMRAPDGRDVTKVVSLLGWRTAPADWGTAANRLPPVTLNAD
jgi:hypothetical protein